MSEKEKTPVVNFMVDIETLGLNKQTAPIVEIAMVPFSSYKEKIFELPVKEPLYIKLNASSQENRIPEEGSLDFHKKLGHDVREFFNSGVGPREAHKMILEYLSPAVVSQYNIKFWCCGTDFDFPILRTFFEEYPVQIKTKWENIPGFKEKLAKIAGFPFYLCNDVRTVYNLAQEYTDWKRESPTEKEAHTAYGDCVSQIKNLYNAEKLFCKKEEANHAIAELQNYWRNEVEHRDRQIAIYESILKLFNSADKDDEEALKDAMRHNSNIGFLIRILKNKDDAIL